MDCLDLNLLSCLLLVLIQTTRNTWSYPLSGQERQYDLLNYHGCYNCMTGNQPTLLFRIPNTPWKSLPPEWMNLGLHDYTVQLPALSVLEKVFPLSRQSRILPLFGKTGMEPMRSFHCKSRSVSAVRLEMEDGRSPTNWLLSSRRLFKVVSTFTNSG